MPVQQLSLFDDPGDDAQAGPRRGRGGEPVAAAPVEAAALRIAATLSDRIRLGTSSWSFPGWTGLVYVARNGRPESEARLAREGLAAYATQPLFRTVSLDRTFYAPLSATEFTRYAAQVPGEFRFVVKAPQAFTDPVVRKPGSGVAARDNPSFLDAAAATATFVTPAVTGLGAKADYAPFDRLVEEDLPTRTALATLARAATAAGRDVFITINNKAEVSAPISVARLAAAIVEP